MSIDDENRLLFSSDFYKSAIIFISPHSAFPFVALLIVFGFIVSV